MAKRRASKFIRPVRLAEYERLRDPDNRLSVVRGMLVREPRPAYGHGLFQAGIAARLRAHAVGSRLGQVVTDVGFIVVPEPLTVHAPDVAFVAQGRIADDPVAVGHPRIAPDLVVEIVSPGERAADLHEKVVDFLDAGTRLAWVVHPRVRQVVEWRSLAEIRVVRRDDLLDGGEVLSGLCVTVDELLSAI